MTHILTIPYDDSVLLETSLMREEFEREAVFLLAAKLYERGRLERLVRLLRRNSDISFILNSDSKIRVGWRNRQSMLL